MSQSPPNHSDTSETMTQGTATQEELTEEERPYSDDNPTADNYGQCKSVLPIMKTPAPDIYGHYPPVEPEPLGQKKTGLQRYASHL